MRYHSLPKHRQSRQWIQRIKNIPISSVSKSSSSSRGKSVSRPLSLIACQFVIYHLRDRCGRWLPRGCGPVRACAVWPSARQSCSPAASDTRDPAFACLAAEVGAEAACCSSPWLLHLKIAPRVLVSRSTFVFGLLRVLGGVSLAFLCSI